MKGFKTEHGKSEKVLFLLSIVFFLVSFACLCIYIKGHYIYHLDSDQASELILSKLLADEKKLVTDNWYYSTELRVLNTQIVYSFFFGITQNWRHVRLLSFGCLYIIMLLSLLFMMDRLRIKKYYFIVAGILCIPISNDYFDVVQEGAYYLPHISISFLAIGLTEWIADSQLRTIKNAALICVSFLLALIAGLGGARQVVVTYMPLLLSGLYIFTRSTVSTVEYDSRRRHISISVKSLTDRRKLYIIASIVSYIGSFIGYVINTKVLSKFFSFHQYNISFSSFDINRLSKVLDGFLNTLGFTNHYVFSYAAIYNAVCFACASAILVALIYGYRQKYYEKLYCYAILCLASMLVFIALYAFSDMPYSAGPNPDRYNLPLIVLFIPFSVFALGKCSLDRRKKTHILIFFVILLALRGGTFYYVEQKTDNTSELRTISSELVNRDYHNGYATFWNANVLTELTNGSIEVWDWASTSSDFECIDQTWQWLQLKSHLSEHPEGKVFWVLTNEQNNNFHFPRVVSPGHIIYETPEDINWDVFEEKDRITRYKVYGFSNYDEMYYLAGRYSHSNEISIASGKTMKTDSTTLYPDTYTMICVGENLDTVEVGLEYKKTIKYKGNNRVWDRLFDVEDLSVEKGSCYMVCEFSLEEIATDIQPVFTNNGDGNAKVSSVQMYKNYVYYADFWSNSWLINGHDEDGIRHLNANAVSYGPYITLTPGKYVVECEGENLDYVSFDCVYNEGERLKSIGLEDIDRSNSVVRITINNDTVLKNFEVRFFNNSNNDVTMHRLTIARE